MNFLFSLASTEGMMLKISMIFGVVNLSAYFEKSRFLQEKLRLIHVFQIKLCEKITFLVVKSVISPRFFKK